MHQNARFFARGPHGAYVSGGAASGFGPQAFRRRVERADAVGGPCSRRRGEQRATLRVEGRVGCVGCLVLLRRAAVRVGLRLLGLVERLNAAVARLGVGDDLGRHPLVQRLDHAVAAHVHHRRVVLPAGGGQRLLRAQVRRPALGGDLRFALLALVRDPVLSGGARFDTAASPAAGASPARRGAPRSSNRNPPWQSPPRRARSGCALRATRSRRGRGRARRPSSSVPREPRGGTPTVQRREQSSPPPSSGPRRAGRARARCLSSYRRQRRGGGRGTSWSENRAPLSFGHRRRGRRLRVLLPAVLGDAGADLRGVPRGRRRVRARRGLRRCGRSGRRRRGTDGRQNGRVKLRHRPPGRGRGAELGERLIGERVVGARAHARLRLGHLRRDRRRRRGRRGVWRTRRGATADAWCRAACARKRSVATFAAPTTRPAASIRQGPAGIGEAAPAVSTRPCQARISLGALPATPVEGPDPRSRGCSVLP